MSDKKRIHETNSISEIQEFNYFEHAPTSLLVLDFSKAEKLLHQFNLKSLEAVTSFFTNNDLRKIKFAESIDIVDVNEKALAMYHASSKEDLIENLDRIFTDKSKIDIANLVLKLINGSEIGELETEHQNLNGIKLPVLMKFQKLGQGHLLPESIICSVEHLKKINRENIQIKAQREAMKISQELAQVSSWFYDYETDYFYWSDEVFNLLEIDINTDLTFEMIMNFVHPEDKLKVHNYSIKHYLENPVQTLQYRIISSKGNLKYVSEKRNVIIENGRIIRFFGTGLDITSRIEAELKIAHSEKMVNSIFDNVNEGVILIDQNAKYSYFNEKAKQILNNDLQALIGTEIAEVDCTIRDEVFIQNYLKAKQEKKTIRLETYHEESKKWFSRLFVPVENQILVIFNEITEKLEVKNKIEEAYKIINASSSVAILTENSKEFPVVFASENTSELFGYPYHDFLNRKLVIEDLIHPNDRNWVRNEFEIYIKNGAVGTYTPKNYRIITHDNQIKWVKVSIKAIKNEQGDITHIQGIFEDITEFKKTSDKLEESRRMLQFQFYNSPLANIIWDNDFNILDWNVSAERIFEYKAEEVIGKNGLDLIVPQNIKPDLNGARTKVINSKGVNKSTNSNITKSGKLITCNWYNISITNPEGEIIGMASLAEDITSRKRAEEILQKSEEKYRSIFERYVDGVMIIENERIIDANSAMLKLLKTDLPTLLEKGVCAFSKQTQDFGRAAYTKGIKNVNITKEHGSSRFRWICLRQDGTEFPSEITLTKITDTSDKFRLHAVVKDISDQIRQEKVERVVFNIAKAAHSISDINKFGVLIKKELGEILDVKNLFFGIYDKKREIISIPIILGNIDEEYKEFSAKNSISGYVIRTNEPIFLTKAGIEQKIKEGHFDLIGTLPELWMGVPMRIKENVIGVFVIQSYDDPNAYDTSDVSVLQFVADQIGRIINRKNGEQELMKAVEKAQESDRLKSAFLSNMSHEIRTPMNGIIGFSELFLNENISQEQRKRYAEIVVKSSNQLLSIVNDILDLSKIEAGAIELTETGENLNEILKDVYLFSENSVKEKGLDLNLKLGLSDEESTIKVDKTKLQQVFNNLISNSLKFTEKGTVEMGYSLEGEKLKFYVSDTGIGIGEEFQKKVFDRFVQEEQTNLTKIKGSGLGLSICKKIIELFNGEIWLTSGTSGTTVYFTIPYNKVLLEISDQKKPLQDKLPLEKMNEITILVAEDEEFNMFYINELFSQKGYKLIEATNGVEAVELAKKHEEIDLILMDIKMPRLNGKEAMKQIKAFRPEVPIIALTAYAMESDRKEALEIGFDSFLTKPIERNTLFEKIEKLLSPPN